MPPLNPQTPDQRPSPEALLANALQEQRGRLKIFLGAAPGVGKTYEMLKVARTLKREGVDVVAGVVETHGRKETEALLRGLEVVPRRTVEYKGRTLDEMDLDAVLQRRPHLVLVDELAHTNAPGSRHPKRYLDVEELLETGINVYTTLNIQHIESLNDVVARITRIRVRETLPDVVLDRADEIELVDLTPEDLIKRLHEGKVYVPEQAQRAIAHFFSPGNLTALRELALRRTAQRVDEQMLTYMRAHAIRGPWAAGERVLVCIDENTAGVALVRHARRVADRLRAKWTALHVETSRDQRLSEVERDRIADTLRLAERLGGEALTLPGSRIAEDIIAYAQANNITQIVLGKSGRPRWFEILHGSVVHDLVRRAGHISVLVMAGDTDEPVPAKTVKTKPPAQPPDLRAYAWSALMIMAAVLVSLVIDEFVPVANLSLVFMVAVLGSAIRYGLGPSLATAFVSVLAYNFFFLPPLYTFTIADPANVVALVFFLILAVLTSNLAARTRAQYQAARDRAKTTGALYAFSRKLAGIGTLDDLLWATAFQIASMLHVRVVLLLPDSQGRGLAVRAGYPPEDRLEPPELAAAQWSWDHNRAAGRGAETLPGSRWLFLPLRTQRGPVGVVGIDADAPGPLLTPDQRRLLDALADQAAVAIERITLAADVDEARLLSETERLRAALLTSLSHDLRTPLAAILGAVTSLRSFWDSYDRPVRDELIRTIEDEAERLNRFIRNLLDMTRLESGALMPKRELVDLADLVGTALQRTSRVLAMHEVQVDLAPDLPMLEVDFLLFEQVLVNLLDNAAKYAPAGTVVGLAATRQEERVMITVRDEGPGLPPDSLDRIFDKFYRVQAADRQRAGTGLGLAICRGFVEALGGRIAAGNRADRPGAVFTIELPVPADQPTMTESIDSHDHAAQHPDH